jgi:hypothetical protein
MAKGNGNGAQAPQFNTETLRGDIRDMVLSEFKLLPKPWQQMNEEEQERLINRADDVAAKLVNTAVDLIAARELPALAITVAKFTVDGSQIKGTYTCNADDGALLLIRDLSDKRAIFVLADPASYAGEKAPAETEVVGDLAMPKTGPGAPSDPVAESKIGRGN